MNIFKSVSLISIIVSSFILFSCTDYSKNGLFTAIDNGDIRSVEKIMAKIHLDSCKYDDVYSPLIYAIATGSYDVAKFLIPHSDLTETDREGRNALLFAILNSKNDLVDSLLRAGMDANYQNPFDGYYAIHYAVEQNNTEITKTLLENGAGIDSIGSDITALHIAIMHGQNKQAIFLLENGANIEIPSINDWNILTLTLANNNVEILAYLIDNYKLSITIEDFKTVCIEGNLETIKYILEKKLIDPTVVQEYLRYVSDIEVCELFLKNGASVNYTNTKSGLAAIHMACINGNLPLLQLLQKNGADIELKVKKGALVNYTPLMLAAIYSEGIESLGTTLSNLNNIISMTPLFSEVTGTSQSKTKENSMALVKQLVEWGADTQYKAQGKTALSIAKESENNEVEAFLTETMNK